VYASTDGIRMTDLVTDTIISTQLKLDWESRVTQAVLSKIALVYWRNSVLVALPVDGSSINNEVWCYDLRYKSWIVLTGLTIVCWIKGSVPYV